VPPILGIPMANTDHDECLILTESRQPIEAFLETTTDKALLAQKIGRLKNVQTCSEYGVFEIFIKAKVNMFNIQLIPN